MVKALKKFWFTIRLLKRADTAFDMASRGKDELALRHLESTETALGPLAQYMFGIEPALLEVFIRGCVVGIKADDYDWAALQSCILSASEYNAAEKLHLIVYLEELATTAGASLPVSDFVSQPAQTGRVRRQLIDRFPRLSDAQLMSAFHPNVPRQLSTQSGH
jgi:hypothetical protein